MNQNITLEFGTSLSDIVGQVSITKPLDLPLHEYGIMPSYEYDKETKQFKVTGYGLVHRSHISSELDTALGLKDAEFTNEKA